jgi:hypothetical protein
VSLLNWIMRLIDDDRRALANAAAQLEAQRYEAAAVDELVTRLDRRSTGRRIDAA